MQRPIQSPSAITASRSASGRPATLCFTTFCGWRAAERPTTANTPLATHGTRVVGIAVDEVMDVQAISEEHVESHGGARDALIRGLGHLENGVVVLVDIHTLVTQVLL